MLRHLIVLLALIFIFSCTDEKAEREKRLKEKQDSVFLADSLSKADKQKQEMEKAKLDSTVQHEFYHQKEEQDSVSKAEEIQKFKWKHREPPKSAPKKEEKLPKPPSKTGN